MNKDQIIVVNISGRGDKDVAAIARYRGSNFMSKIAQGFDHGKAFIPFVTAGDPDLETTKELLPVLQESGADLIEIGIPFSDPVAEGIVIQKADEELWRLERRPTKFLIW